MPLLRNRDRNPFVIKNEGAQVERPYADAEWDQAALLGTDNRRVSSLRHTQAKKRLAIFFIFTAIILTALYVRGFYLQIIAGDDYLSQAEGNRLRVEYIPAPRGEILDRFGLPLVQNDVRFILNVLPPEMPRDPEEETDLFVRLGKIISYDPQKIQDRWQATASRRAAEITLIETLSREAALRFYEERRQFPALRLVAAPGRFFPTNSAAIIIGQIAPPQEHDLKQNPNIHPVDTVGVSGLEYFYDQKLRGQPGFRSSEVDNRGRIIEEKDIRPPVPGNSLKTTIDKELQETVFAALKKAIQAAGSKRGAAVILDPRSGAVRSLVSLPSYDPNELAGENRSQIFEKLAKDPDQPFFQRAVSGAYPPGSTLKPIIAAAALAEKIITKETTFLSTGGLRIGEWFFPDWRAGGHGMVNVTKAISESVNTFFYLVGGGMEERGVKGLGIDRIRQYAESFGLNQRLGIDLPGEETGFFPSKEWKENMKGERWYIGDTYHAAIGQGDVLVTPLQMAAAAGAVAAGGQLWKPHLAESEPVLLRQVMPQDKDLAVVRQAMRQAVLEGSARRLAALPISVAGKTGTAQGVAGADPHGWFVGFAPFENPEIAFSIIIEEGGEGSQIAVPVAEEILRWYYQNRTEKK